MLNFRKSIVKASKMTKMAVFELFTLPNLISRKIQEAVSDSPISKQKFREIKALSIAQCGNVM